MTATVDTGGSWIRSNTSGSWFADYSVSLQQYHNWPGATLETAADSGPGITSESGHARIFNSEGPDRPDNPRAKGSPIYKASIKLRPVERSDTDKRDISVKVVTTYGQVVFMYKWVPAGR